MHSLLMLIDAVLNLYMWCLIIAIVMHWLIAFNVINTQNRLVYQVYDFLYRITEPMLLPIRRRLPNLGGVDISPIILILAIWFIRSLMWEYLA